MGIPARFRASSRRGYGPLTPTLAPTGGEGTNLHVPSTGDETSPP